MPRFRAQPSLPKTGPGDFQPYYLRQTQRWAVDAERQRHLQALYTVGEWTMFCLLWHLDDYKNGLVDRCPECYTDNRYAQAYKQPERNKCPNCYGTTFKGGFRALIVRPAIFDDADEDEQFQKRGVVFKDSLNLESTPDFRVRTGDYCFRSTGHRYILRVPERVTLRTGFATPYQRSAAIGYNHARAAMEDHSSVAHMIPPVDEDVKAILEIPATEPLSFAAYEIIRAPLIPVSDPF